MSHKFDKGRSVDYRYEKIPLAYPGLKHPEHPDKELVLMDWMYKHYTAAWRNNKRISVGPTFLLKSEVRNGKAGFIFRDKWYPVSGVVW
jgi:hypothetical protein